MNIPFDPIGGSLPASWRFTTIGEICDENDGEVQTGPFGSQLHAGDYVDDGVPSVMPKDIIGDRISTKSIARVPEKDAARLSVHRLRTGDIVYARRGDIGRRAIVSSAEEGWLCGTGCLRIRLNAPGVSPEYLLAYLGHPGVRAWVESKAQGATMLNLNTSILRSVPFRVPPLPEQRRIADILDKADAIRRKRKEAIALTEQLLRSAFLEMFGDPVTNPKEWEVKPLGEVAEVNRGKFSPRPRNDPRFYGGDFPFIQTGDLRNCVGYLRAWKQTLNEEGCAVSRGFARGTVAIAIAANIGDTAIVDFDFYCPDSVVGIVPNANVTSPEYIEMMLRFFQPKLIAEAPETAQKNINLETLRPLAVPLPPQGQQQAFAAVYRNTYAVAARLDGGLVAANNLFDALVHRAFRGELSDAAGPAAEKRLIANDGSRIGRKDGNAAP